MRSLKLDNWLRRVQISTRGKGVDEQRLIMHCQFRHIVINQLGEQAYLKPGVDYDLSTSIMCHLICGNSISSSMGSLLSDSSWCSQPAVL